MKQFPKTIVNWIQTTKLFWKLYFWYQIRAASKRREERIQQGKDPLL